MKKILSLRPAWSLGIFVILDLICVGIGMGVPIFCILLGFITGWYIVRYITLGSSEIPEVLRRVLRYAALTSSITLLLMLIIWGPTAAMLFDPTRDLANFGIPLFLYEPRASFVGWLILMILISPFLQLLTTLFSAYLTLMYGLNKSSIPIKM